MPDRDDREDTPVEVPFPKFEGPTDKRLKLKEKMLDPRLSGAEHDSERPVLPVDVSDRELAVAFKSMAAQNADLAAEALEERKKTNDLLELVDARLKTLSATTVAPSPRGYWLIVGAVIVLTVLQLSEIAILRHVLQLLAAAH